MNVNMLILPARDTSINNGCYENWIERLFGT